MYEEKSLTERLFEDLFSKYRDGMEALAYSFVGDRATARDIVSQCFTKLWEKRDSVIAGGVVNYLFTMVRNACLDYRKLGRNKEVSERLLDKEGDVMKYYTATIENTDLSDLFSDEILEICRRTIATLPPEQRTAFLKSRVEGLTYQEIADSMGLSYSRVNKDIFKALSKLRLSLKDYLGVLICLLIMEQHSPLQTQHPSPVDNPPAASVQS